MDLLEMELEYGDEDGRLEEALLSEIAKFMDKELEAGRNPFLSLEQKNEI